MDSANINLETLATLIAEIGILLGVITPVIVWLRKLINGEKCQLRKDMLEVYYRCRDERVIRQYEFESFVYMYEAYKQLKGNSFIDKVYKEVQGWKVIQ